MLRLAICTALLLAAASAGEHDAGHAAPDRWTHVRGPASGNGRSLADPPRWYGGIEWTYAAKKALLAPPVTWDGTAFLVDGDASAAALVALDVESGEEIARAPVKSPGADPKPAVSRGSVFLLEDGRRLVQYESNGRRLTRAWSFDLGAGAGAPAVFQGEIYATGKDGLVRLRAGRSRAVWAVAGAYRGQPAVFRGHVYALVRDDTGRFAVAVHDRNTGEAITVAAPRKGAPDARGGRVAVAEGIVAALIPSPENDEWAFFRREEERDLPKLEWKRTRTLRTEPLVGRNLALALTPKGAWTMFSMASKQAQRPITSRDDLVDGATACIALGDEICFGTWAANLSGNRILWHLDELPDVRTFARGLRFPAVPAGHERLLVVPRDGKSLRLVGSEEIG